MCQKRNYSQGNRIKTANKKACDYSICGSITGSLRRLKYTQFSPNLEVEIIA